MDIYGKSLDMDGNFISTASLVIEHSIRISTVIQTVTV